MSDTTERRETPARRALTRAGLVTAVAVVAAAIVTFGVAALLEGRLEGRPRLATLLQVKVFVSTFNIVVLFTLTATYMSVYRDLPNRFTLSLILFSLSLLLYALTANPLVHLLFGFRGAPLGPFTFLPDLFASFAAVLLLYQSFR